jgi:hypothetical protein
MPAHDFGEGFGVGWGWGDRGGCGFGDGGDFAEVVRGEDAGADDGERPGCCGVEVVEAVDRSARDAERVAGADLDFASIEREGDDAFDAVDGLLVGVVAVGDGHFGSGGDVELEDGDGASGVLAFYQEANRQLPQPYLFPCVRRHRHRQSLSFSFEV